MMSFEIIFIWLIIGVGFAGLFAFLVEEECPELLLLLIPAMLILGILLASISPTLYETGDSHFELSNDVKYVCPNCGWNGTTSGMVEKSIGDGDYRYYYCPECGSIMGRQDIANPIPLGVMTCKGMSSATL